jgi:hypothetical protein
MEAGAPKEQPLRGARQRASDQTATRHGPTRYGVVASLRIIPRHRPSTHARTRPVQDASDVVFGAFDGIIIGRSVTWHGRHFFSMTPTVVPGGGGAMVMTQF